MLRLRQDDARFIDEHPPGVGKLDMALRSVEQSHPKLGFQLSNLLTERRLAEVEPLGRVAEMERVGHRHNVTQMTELHAGGALLSGAAATA